MTQMTPSVPLQFYARGLAMSSYQFLLRADFFIVKTLSLIGKVSKKGIFLKSIKVNKITDQIKVAIQIMMTKSYDNANVTYRGPLS